MDSHTSNSPAPDDQPQLELTASRQFVSWLSEQRISLALTTYQTGKLFLVGLQPNGRLSIFERTFNRCMGLWSNGQTMWMSSLYQLWRFENVLDAGQLADGYDRLYVPQVGYTTGDIDIHDISTVEADKFSQTTVNYVKRINSTLSSYGERWTTTWSSVSSYRGSI